MNVVWTSGSDGRWTGSGGAPVPRADDAPPNANSKRWELLKTMAGKGPLTIRGVSRHVARDVKAVHGDVHALLDAGLLDKTAKNQVVFPFDAIRVEFTPRAA